MKPLEGKTALVTGGSRGIGRAIVEQLSAEGAHVLSASRSGKSPTIDGVATVAADLATDEGLAALFAACDAAFGGAPNLDILVNNAGVGSDGESAALRDASPALFDRMMALNVRAPYLVTKGALPRLRDNGRIVNIGSVAGRVAQPYAAGYGMGKRALQSLTLSTAVEVAKRGITCNLIAPGAVDTDFIATLRARPGFDEGTIRMTPMGRMGRPEDIAGAVMMLCRAEAGWVTGNVIEAAGGLAL